MNVRRLGQRTRVSLLAALLGASCTTPQPRGPVALVARPPAPIAETPTPSPPPEPVQPPAESREPAVLLQRARAHLDSLFPGATETRLDINTGVQNARLHSASMDAACTRVVAGGEEAATRVWSALDGTLLATLEVPSQPGALTKIFSTAISPDGRTIALGDGDGSVHFFDGETYQANGRIDGLPNSVTALDFSADGQLLAVGIWGQHGIRVYEVPTRHLVLRAGGFGADCYGLDFSPDGSKLAATSWDRVVRVYDLKSGALTRREMAARSTDIAFSPDGSQLLVGLNDGNAVQVLDPQSLRTRRELRVKHDYDSDNLSSVAWSRDGQTIHASGRYSNAGYNEVRRWTRTGRPLPAFRINLDTTQSLSATCDGGVLIASMDPMVAMLDASGNPRWTHFSRRIDFVGQRETFRVSADGTAVEFGMERYGKRIHSFSVAGPSLSGAPASDVVAGPRVEASRFRLESWQNDPKPTLDGRLLPLKRFETARSLAIAADDSFFILGAEWSLYRFDPTGSQTWRIQVPGVPRVVTLAAGDRLVVVGFEDGTIRWLRANTGVQVLALFIDKDGVDWVLWTPDGFYAGTPRGADILGFRLHRDQATPMFVPIRELAAFLENPEVVRHALDNAL